MIDIVEKFCCCLLQAYRIDDEVITAVSEFWEGVEQYR